MVVCKTASTLAKSKAIAQTVPESHFIIRHQTLKVKKERTEKKILSYENFLSEVVKMIDFIKF